MMKNKFKVMLVMIIGIILGSSISIYATYNYFASDVKYKKEDGTEVSVETALNELYLKSNEINYPYIEEIYSNSSSKISYSYNVDSEGVFVVGGSAVPNRFSITTTGEVVQDIARNFEKIKIIKAQEGDTINISGTNNQYNAGGYIVKLHNITIEEIINSNSTYDNTASTSYTCIENNEKLLILAFSCGRDRSENIAFNGIYTSSEYHKNNCYISVAMIKKGTKVDATAYGNVFSTASTYIFKGH